MFINYRFSINRKGYIRYNLAEKNFLKVNKINNRRWKSSCKNCCFTYPWELINNVKNHSELITKIKYSKTFKYAIPRCNG